MLAKGLRSYFFHSAHCDFCYVCLQACWGLGEIQEIEQVEGGEGGRGGGWILECGCRFELRICDMGKRTARIASISMD